MKPFPTSAACCFGILFISVSLITTGSSEVQVVGSADPVVALAGDDIILPCFLKPRVNAKDMVVKWTRFNLTTTEDVHLYRDGRVDHFPSYSERTSLFNDELKNGNVSLKLTRVTLSDAGSYRCFIPTLTSQVKETTVQLFVGAVSQPVISIDGTKGWGVVLKCESGGWFPEPEMVWLDSSGSILPADGPPERHSDSEGLYTVIRHVTVDKTDTNRFTCIVQQPEINHLKETEIHVPDEVFPKSQVGLIVGLLITAAVGVLAACIGVYMWRKHKAQFRWQKAPPRLQNDQLRWQKAQLRKQNDQLRWQKEEVSRLNDQVTRERDELKEKLRKAEETIQTLKNPSTSPGGQQKTQTPSQKGMEMKPLLGPEMEMQPLLGPGMEMKPLLGPGMEMQPLLGPGMEMKPLLGPGMEMKPLLGPEMEMQPLLESEGIEDEGMEMESLPDSGRKSLLGPGMEMRPLLGSGPQKDDLDEMERGGRV